MWAIIRAIGASIIAFWGYSNSYRVYYNGDLGLLKEPFGASIKALQAILINMWTIIVAIGAIMIAFCGYSKTY